jgi:hypothetical protein
MNILKYYNRKVVAAGDYLKKKIENSKRSWSSLRDSNFQ